MNAYGRNLSKLIANKGVKHGRFHEQKNIISRVMRKRQTQLTTRRFCYFQGVQVIRFDQVES